MSIIYPRFSYPTNICQLGQGGSAGDGIIVEEVGEGSVLPADASEFELFRLEGHASLPDGLYAWNETNGYWVQA